MAAQLALALLLNREESRRIPRNRFFRNRHPALELPENAFKKCFRLDKETYLFLCDKISRYLPSSRFSVEVRVLAALRFFATGDYQTPVANDESIIMSQPTISRVIRHFSRAVSNHLLQEYIKFPTTENERSVIRRQFLEKSGFPGTVGAIDCTHVAIVTPSEHAQSYINRKLYHSINVQLIVGPDTRIYGISARYPGSVHDAFIWRNSAARDYVSQMNSGWLVGDSGYPLEPWLLTPFLNTAPGSVEEHFNYKLSSARVSAERCNGILKGRFRCLLKDRTLHYSPNTACHIINACAVLHNICVNRNLQIGEDEFAEDDDVPVEPPTTDPTVRARNLRYRVALSIA